MATHLMLYFADWWDEQENCHKSLVKNKLFTRYNQNINDQRYHKEYSDFDEKTDRNFYSNNYKQKVFSISNKNKVGSIPSSSIHNQFLPASSQRKISFISSCSDDTHNDNETAKQINKQVGYEPSKMTTKQNYDTWMNNQKGQSLIKETLPNHIESTSTASIAKSVTFSNASIKHASPVTPVQQHQAVIQQPTPFQDKTDNKNISLAHKNAELPMASSVTVVKPIMRDVNIQTSSVSIRVEEQEKKNTTICCNRSCSVRFCC